MKRILVTNDDGIESRGIEVLAEAMSALGEVTIVAPDREMSAISHAITLGRPLRVRERRPGWHSVSGTPTDCVYIGVVDILEGKLDLVVSGINQGANIGEDVHYSGTVAGAVEGSIFGYPAIAFSQIPNLDVGLEQSAAFAAELAAAVLDNGLAGRTLLNVNFPPPPAKGIKLTRLGRHVYEQAFREESDDGDGRLVWIGGNEIHQEQDPDTDAQAVHEGFISVTPLQLDMTDQPAREHLAAWKMFGGR